MIKLTKPYISALITYLTVVIMFGFDQWTKHLVIEKLPITIDFVNKSVAVGSPSYPFLPWLWFTHVVNFGSAFSTFYGRKILLVIFAGAISLGIIAYERMSVHKRTKVLSFSLGFLLAGAFGNLFDRIRLGYVTDFLDIRWKGDNIFAIFNGADISINLGIYLLIIYFFFQEGKLKKQQEQEQEDDDMPMEA